MRVRRLFTVICCALAAGLATAAAQPAQTPPAATTPAPPADALDRDTPRGTVLAFLAAGRRGDQALARHYLNTRATGRAGEELARQLFVVLDARLPARLPQVSGSPDGSRANPLAPDEEQIGTVAGPDGPIEVTVERVKESGGQRIWLFSKKTLDEIPAAYADVVNTRATVLPRFMIDWRIGSVPIGEWLAVLLFLPALYLLTVVLNRVLTPLVAWIARRTVSRSGGLAENALPAPARLLIVSLAARAMLAALPLSLLTRQILANVASLVAICSVAWLLVLLNGVIEAYIIRRIPASNFSAAVSLLRVGRRLSDVVIVLAGTLAILAHFGVDPTPLLAGLGVGGLAIALAAQKTLENVIAGASLIVDQAVRVGDFLRVGTLEGTVEHIGLRSTRIRTMDRSLVSVPNSQIANMSLETLSARDKFWFHPSVGLRYATTPDQLQAVLEGIRSLLRQQPAVDVDSVRARFQRLGAFSLDVEISAYIQARDWAHFLEIQEDLLVRITQIVEHAGTAMAFPTQTMVVEGATSLEAASGGLPH